MTTEATTPAVASAAPAAEAQVTSSEAESLLPAASGSPTPVAAPAVTPATPAVSPPAAPVAEWFYADGTPGKGEMPVWFKADRYKTVEKQAEAYDHLEKRFGAFTGAPKDGKYEVKLPEGVGVELVNDHPLLTDFQKWAAEHQLNQGGYNELIGMLAQYEAAKIPDMNEIKGQLGVNADARITAVAQWAQANLTPVEYQKVQAATTGSNAAAVLEVLEGVIAKTKQVVLPKPGQDVVAAQPMGRSAIEAMMQKRDSNGQLMYFADEKYRANVDAETRRLYESQAA